MENQKKKQIQRTPKMCSTCRRLTVIGIKKLKSKSFKRQFCYEKQLFMENLEPIICNSYKKIFEPEVQIINSSN